jgi:hypothetical protein
MRNIILAIVLAFSVIGCGSEVDTTKVQPKLTVGKTLDLQLKDQHEKPQTLPDGTKIVFFSFSKPVGHMCNAFLEANPKDFLPQHHIVYVADVSPAPSIIKSMFILPDLKKLKFPILLINDDQLSAEFTKGMDKESIVVVYLDKNKTITQIKNLHSEKELEALFNDANKS